MPFIVHVYLLSPVVPIAGARVYLFADGGTVEAPEYADHSGVTGSDGRATIPVEGCFRVGVVHGCHTAGDPNQMPPEGWRETYSAWGAACIPPGDVYDIPLKPGTPCPPISPAEMVPALLGFTPMAFTVAVVAAQELKRILSL